MHPLYPINDAHPCTPLPIVKRVSSMKPHKSRLLGIAKCTPSVEFLHTHSGKIGHGNLYVPVPDIQLHVNNSSIDSERRCTADLYKQQSSILHNTI